MSTESQKPIQVFVSSENKRFLKQYAANHNYASVSELLRDAIQEFFTNRGVEFDVLQGVNEWGKPKGD